MISLARNGRTISILTGRAGGLARIHAMIEAIRPYQVRRARPDPERSALLVGGVMTNFCGETTARDAFVRDYRPGKGD